MDDCLIYAILSRGIISIIHHNVFTISSIHSGVESGQDTGDIIKDIKKTSCKVQDDIFLKDLFFSIKKILGFPLEIVSYIISVVQTSQERHPSPQSAGNVIKKK